MVLCLLLIFLAVHFDWSIILIRKSFGASRHISGKLGVKLAIVQDNYQKKILGLEPNMESLMNYKSVSPLCTVYFVSFQA